MCVINCILQDPVSIKHQAGGDSGDIYTLVDKTDSKKKSVKKNGSAPKDEIPLHSTPDKSKKRHYPWVSVCISMDECL